MRFKRVIDLSHTIIQDMPVFPGDPKPQIIKFSDVREKGYGLSKIILGSHTGTHIDAPSHMIPDGATLDEIPLEKLMGEALVADLTQINLGEEIKSTHLQKHDVKEGEILLLCTSTSSRWGDKGILTNYPHLSLEAADWLIDRKVKAFGVDCMSIEKYGEKGHPVHDRLLSNKIPIIENLANLDLVKGLRIFFICLPLKLKGTDGAPARALAIEFED